MYAVPLALLSALLFGASTPASKLLLASFAPSQLAGLLYLGAALGVAPVVALEGRRAEGIRWSGANGLRLAGSALFGGVLGPVLLLLALRRTLAGSVSLLLSLELVATALLGVAVFREHLGRGGWAGVAGVVAASALLAGRSGPPGLVAALLVAAACICWGLDNHLIALVDGITAARSTLVKGAVAGTTNLAIGLLAAPFAAHPGAVAAALGVGALCYGASIALYVASSHALGATRAQLAFASAPFLGGALSVVCLGERLDPLQWASAGLLAASLALVLRDRHAHWHEHGPLAHTHLHRHDDGHHLHAHPGAPPSLLHAHWHEHAPLSHDHPHWPDLHHRHRH